MELSGDEPHFIKLAIHASRFGVRFSEWLDSDTFYLFVLPIWQTVLAGVLLNKMLVIIGSKLIYF